MIWKGCLSGGLGCCVSVKSIYPFTPRSPGMQQVLQSLVVWHDVMLGGIGNLQETQRLPWSEGLCTCRTTKVHLNIRWQGVWLSCGNLLWLRPELSDTWGWTVIKAPMKVSSLLLPCGSRKQTLGHQACLQVPFPLRSITGIYRNILITYLQQSGGQTPWASHLLGWITLYFFEAGLRLENGRRTDHLPVRRPGWLLSFETWFSVSFLCLDIYPLVIQDSVLGGAGWRVLENSGVSL